MNTVADTDPESWGAAEVPREQEVEIDAEELSPEVRRLVAKAAWAAAHDATNRVAIPPHNSGRIANGWGPWVRWAIGLAIAGIVTAVGGFISLHSDMAALQQAQSDMRGQVTQMYDWLAPRYRGAGNAQ